MNTTTSDTTNSTTNNEETNDVIVRPATIQVRECTCTNYDGTSITQIGSSKPRRYQYKYLNKYYCLSEYQYCYVPVNNIYSIFYVPSCYNQNTLTTVSRGIWRPTVLMIALLVALLTFTTIGHRAIGGCISIFIAPCCWDQWLANYLLRYKPSMAHYYIQQQIAYQQRQHEQRDEQLEQQQRHGERQGGNTSTTNTTNQQQWNIQSVVQYTRRVLLGPPPQQQPRTTAQATESLPQAVVIAINENQQQQQEGQEDANNNNNFNSNNNENNTDNQRNDIGTTNRSNRRRKKKNTVQVEYEIKTKRYYPKRQLLPIIPDSNEGSSSNHERDIVVGNHRDTMTLISNQPNETNNGYDGNSTAINPIRNNTNATNDHSTTKIEDIDDDKIDGTNRSTDIDNDDDIIMGDETTIGRRALCSICLLEIKPGSRIGNIPCHHLFHIECLKEWIHRRNVCPLCLHPDIATKRPGGQSFYSNDDNNNNNNNNHQQEHDNDDPGQQSRVEDFVLPQQQQQQLPIQSRRINQSASIVAIRVSNATQSMTMQHPVNQQTTTAAAAVPVPVTTNER